MEPPIRVMLAKIGLDGHDHGVKAAARALRDAGMDVIYAGPHRTPDEVVTAAIQEDVDVLGVTLLIGAQNVFPKIVDRLKREGAGDMIIVAGGAMPDGDVAALKQMGVRDVMLQETPSPAMIDRLRRRVAERGPR